MKAIILKAFGGTENLIMDEIPAPEISENEVLIKVKAISINPVDVKTRAGKGVARIVKDFDPIILGWDISGTVTDSKSSLFKKGDEVFGMVNFPGHGKAYAEYVAAPAEQLTLKPGNISHEEAAAATLAALTAWQNLVDHVKIKAGQRVLIHAAAGGVGHYAVQIAKNKGAYVIGTSSAENKDFVLSLGADEHVDYTAQRFEDVIADIDFVLDTIGGDNIDRSIKVTKPGGTVISIPSGINEAVKEIAKARGVIAYNTMVESNGDDMKQIAELLKDGRMKSYISHTFSFDEIGKAHQLIETGKTKGKAIIII